MLSCEIWWKFQVMPGSEAFHRADDVFGPTAHQDHQVTTYHVTPDKLMFTSGLTLRIRQKNDSFLQSVGSNDDIAIASRRKQ